MPTATNRIDVVLGRALLDEVGLASTLDRWFDDKRARGAGRGSVRLDVSVTDALKMLQSIEGSDVHRGQVGDRLGLNSTNRARKAATRLRDAIDQAGAGHRLPDEPEMRGPGRVAGEAGAKVAVSIRFDPEVLERIDKLAESRDVARTHILAEAVDAYLARRR